MYGGGQMMVGDEAGQAGGTSPMVPQEHREFETGRGRGQSPDGQCALWENSPLGGTSKAHHRV